MKNLVVTILAISLTSAALARSPIGQQSADLTKISIAKGLGYKENFSSGTVTVDLYKKAISLQLNRDFYCPVDTYCALVMPEPIQLQTPLISQEEDSCGALHYKGVQRSSVMDGFDIYVTVTDYSGLLCEIAVPALTVVKMRHVGGIAGATYHSIMYGNELQPR